MGNRCDESGDVPVRGAIRKPKQNQDQIRMTFPRRGEIYLVEFDPARGHEIQKTRPAVIVQNDVSNRNSPVTIVAAVSSQIADSAHPRDVPIAPGGKTGLNKAAAAILNQIRSIDQDRLVRRLGEVDDATMRRIDAALKISLGFVDP